MMKLKTICLFLLISVLLVVSFVSCGGTEEGTTSESLSTNESEESSSSSESSSSGTVTEDSKTTEGGNSITTEDGEQSSTETEGSREHEDDGQSTTEATVGGNTEEDDTVKMVFSGTSCRISDVSTVTVSGKIYKIVKPGTYRISGTLTNGQIQVEVQKTERVTLLLDNFNGSCSDSGVIYVKSADKVFIDLEKNSVNTLTDGSTYVFEDPADAKPNACIYSSDDLTIKGGGTLTVNANYNNGIGCKNDIDIKNGIVKVTAVNNAIKGNDSVTVCGDAAVTILGAEDGIKTENTDETGKGFVMVTEEATVNITCSDDAIQATQNITVTSGASVTTNCGGNAINCDGTQNIATGSVRVN